MKQHFPDVEADLIEPREVSAKRLQSNDINLLLGWDACSAYMEEFPDDRVSRKHMLPSPHRLPLVPPPRR